MTVKVRNLRVLVFLFGAYALVDGIFALIAAFQAASRRRGFDWRSVGWPIVEGLAGIIAGLLTFSWPGVTALVLLYFIGAWAIVTAIAEIVQAIALRRVIQNEWLLILGGVLSIVFGSLLFVFPRAGALAIVWLIGSYAIVFGILLIGLSLHLRALRARRDHDASILESGGHGHAARYARFSVGVVCSHQERYDMVALVSFLLVLTLSLIIERIATVALTLTGLSRDAAGFQARSAFTGTGFTTSEAEQVVSHPARRRIVLWLMGVRSFEIITGVSALVLLFLGSGSTRESVTRSLWLAAGLVVLGVAASNKWLDRHMSRLIAWVLRRWTTLDVRDYFSLLGLASGYTVWELPVDADSWMAHKSLEEMQLPEEGLTVLAIQRAGGSFVGAPHRGTVIRPRDTLILYGHSDRLAELSTRQLGQTGDLAHADAVEAQRLLLRDEELDEDRNSASTSVGPNRATT